MEQSSNNGNLYAEKITMYFSSMNSLSGKIFADVQAVEGSVTKLTNNLSYNEKSRIIDKHLIHDVVLKNKRKQQKLRTMANATTGKDLNSGNLLVGGRDQLEEQDIPANQIFYDDPDLDKDQVAALVMSVYPKKPEKYVYEDNSFFLDEHSEPFSYCTQNQASFCGLEKLVRDLPVPTLPLSSSSLAHSKKSNSKSRSLGTSSGSRHHREKKAPAPLPNSGSNNNSRRSSDEILNPAHGNEIEEEKEKDKKVSNGSSTRVKNMERESEYPPPNNSDTKQPAFMLGVPLMGFLSSSKKNSTEKKPQPRGGINSEMHRHTSEEEESNLPQQVQNSDLIAELKLKMNKGKKGLQHTPSLTKKPKAPPPPPPTNVNKRENSTESKSTGSVFGDDKQEKPTKSPQMMTAGAQSLSSTATTKKPEKTTVMSLVNNHHSNNDGVAATTTTNSTLNSTNPEKSEEDFCVDVSSPCRIVVKRTGLDILDDW